MPISTSLAQASPWSGNRFPEEFRIEAVKQITERGYPVAEVASRLGVSQYSLVCGAPLKGFYLS